LKYDKNNDIPLVAFLFDVKRWKVLETRESDNQGSRKLATNHYECIMVKEAQRARRNGVTQ